MDVSPVFLVVGSDNEDMSSSGGRFGVSLSKVVFSLRNVRYTCES